MLMEVENTDSKPFSFTSLFHTYIRVSDFRKTTVSGLKGLRYIDKVNACEGVEEREQVTVFEKPVDRIYVRGHHDCFANDLCVKSHSPHFSRRHLR